MEYSRQEHLLFNQARILYYQSLTTILFPALACPALCLLLWEISDHRRLLTWAAAVILFTLSRYAMILKQRQKELSPDNAGKWLDMFTVNAMLSGILWGMSAIILVPYKPDALIVFTLYNGLTILVICGLVAGAVISYSVSKWVLFFYAFPALAPPAFYLISLGDMYNSFLGGFVLLYLVFITIASFRLNSQYRYYMDMEYRLLHLRQEYDELKALYSKTTRSMSVRRERHEVS
jgi:hypothetical protein